MEVRWLVQEGRIWLANGRGGGQRKPLQIEAAMSCTVVLARRRCGREKEVRRPGRGGRICLAGRCCCPWRLALRLASTADCTEVVAVLWEMLACASGLGWRPRGAPGAGGEIGQAGTVENRCHCSDLCLSCIILCVWLLQIVLWLCHYSFGEDCSESYFLCVSSFNWLFWILLSLCVVTQFLKVRFLWRVTASARFVLGGVDGRESPPRLPRHKSFIARRCVRLGVVSAPPLAPPVLCSAALTIGSRSYACGVAPCSYGCEE